MKFYGLVTAFGIALMFSRAPEPAPVTRLSPPPAAMSTMVKATCDGRWRGWAVPYGSTFAMTVAHVIDGCTSIGWESGARHGDFIVLRREFKNDSNGIPLKDYALLLSSESFDSWAEVSKRKPVPGELLWHRLLLPEMVPVNAPGWYLGLDQQGFMEMEATSYPGSSGSGWFNTEGQVVAVGNGSYGASYGRTLAWATPLDMVFSK